MFDGTHKKYIILRISVNVLDGLGNEKIIVGFLKPTKSPAIFSALRKQSRKIGLLFLVLQTYNRPSLPWILGFSKIVSDSQLPKQ